MSQRGITKRMLEKVLDMGEPASNDKIVLNKKIGLKLLKELDAARKDFWNGQVKIDTFLSGLSQTVF
jgi:hypothetical protein